MTTSYKLLEHETSRLRILAGFSRARIIGLLHFAISSFD